MNMLSNALDAMSRGGRLRIRTAAHNGAVRLVLSDTGVGVSPENMEKIFDPFFTTKRGGTGLGLPLARRIVEAHGGAVTCESIRRVGTTFTLSLPACGRPGQEGTHGEN